MKKNTSTLVIGMSIVALGVVILWNALKPGQSDTTSTAGDTAQVSTLTDTNWTIASVADQPVLAGTLPFAQFGSDGRLSGSDGCNTFSTGYSVDGDQLTVDPAMISTKMACEPAVMDQADQITQLLLATTSFAITGDQLSLQQGSSMGLTLTDNSVDLADSAWTVTNYNNGNEAVVSPILDTTVTLTFAPDGSLSGSAGCNSFFGSYQLDESNITIGSIGSTEMFCESPEGLMEQEAAVLAALPTAATWEIMGDQLWIRSDDDAIVLIATTAGSSSE